jgi:endonuclease/exonuclease/phosphatase family metal-dependent hydrolase
MKKYRIIALGLLATSVFLYSSQNRLKKYEGGARHHPVSNISVDADSVVGAEASFAQELSTLEETENSRLREEKNALSVQEELELLDKTPGAKFTIFSANTHLFPPIIHNFGSPMKNETPLSRAKRMGQAVRARSDNEHFDVVVLQEAWDIDCRKAFYKEIKDVYPYAIEDDYQSVLALVGLDVMLGSGLAIYSKYPFQPMLTRNKKVQNFFLETFKDYRGDECFAHKGFLGIKIVKDGVPVYVINTHLQAGASDVDRKYLMGASRDSTREVAKKEMMQIKDGIKFVIMNDYYNAELQRILASCRIDNGGIKGLFNKYFWNPGKSFFSKARQMATGSQASNTDQAQEVACVASQIETFINKTPDFWNNAYIILAGDFNINTRDDDYEDIVTVFGKKADVIMSCETERSTSYTDIGLQGSGELKALYRIDYILSIGKSFVQKEDGARVLGGSYISSIFDHTHTDHVAMEAQFKLEQRS